MYVPVCGHAPSHFTTASNALLRSMCEQRSVRKAFMKVLENAGSPTTHVSQHDPCHAITGCVRLSVCLLLGVPVTLSLSPSTPLSTTQRGRASRETPGHLKTSRDMWAPGAAAEPSTHSMPSTPHTPRPAGAQRYPTIWSAHVTPPESAQHIYLGMPTVLERPAGAQYSSHGMPNAPATSASLPYGHSTARPWLQQLMRMDTPGLPRVLRPQGIATAPSVTPCHLVPA
jgi:hypothetical protein